LEAAEFEAEAFDGFDGGIVGFGVVAEDFGDGLMVERPDFEVVGDVGGSSAVTKWMA
jgi:hypothetical protein